MSRGDTANGGTLLPHPQPPTLVTAPPNLTFVQFMQTVLVALSEFPGPLVRPDWQEKPPKQPDIGVDWLAFGLGDVTPDNNAYISVDENDVGTLQRNELIPVTVNVYGPNAYDNAGLIRDGFQLSQNLTSLRKANVGFAFDGPARHVPDFFNERWYERWIYQFSVRRQINRLYPILTFASANGTIYADAAKETITLPYAASGE